MWQFDNVAMWQCGNSHITFFVQEVVVSNQLGLNGTRMMRILKIDTDFFLIRFAKADDPEVSGGFVCAIFFFF
jgi:hypothetical protein